MYSADDLLSHNDFSWISRVPESIKEAKNLVQKLDSEISWTSTERGYKFSSFYSDYGKVAQRWMLVYSQQAYDREFKTFEKNLAKKTLELEKEMWHLFNQLQGCEADAVLEIKKITKRYQLHIIQTEIELQTKNEKVGRPKKDAGKIYSVS